MGASNSKIEDDKALTLCRERKRFVKQALDGRCLLAAAHVSYVQSLRNTGTALRKFVEPEVLDENSLHASTSTAPELHSFPLKPNSHLSNTSPSLSPHVEASQHFSPTPSPPLSGRFHVNLMAAARIPSVTIEERPPVLLAATVQTLSPSRCSESHSNENSFHVNYMKTAKVPSTTFEERPPTIVRATVEASSPMKISQRRSEENSSSEAPPPPGTPPWDYFGLFHPLDNQFSIEEGKVLGHGFDNADDIRRLREEEGIPELEDEGEQAFSHDKDEDSMDSGDEFDQISDEPLVQIYRNRNDGLDDPSTNSSLPIPSADSIASENDQENGQNTGPNIGLRYVEETSVVKFLKTSSTTVALPMNGKMEYESESKSSEKDFVSCMKEIEVLFLKASDSGGEVRRMLEANKLQFRPLFTEEIADKWKASAFLSSCFACCKEEVQSSQAPASNEMKYLPWHGSVSFRSSSSRIPFSIASKDDAEDLSSDLYGSACMNSGSHASTLDRLYAWERKLYDEVKASGFIRREYDLKCRLLRLQVSRLQDSRAESAYKIDKTRAAVKDLHSRIRVAIHRINSISKSIEDIRDKELQPQLEELIGGLTRMWAMMLECHNNQHKIISGACNKDSCKVSVQSESHRQATRQLQFELSSLSSSFTYWIAAHKSYLKAINNWLLKCVLMAPVSKQKSSRRNQSQFSPRKDIAPAIFVTCQDWLALMDESTEKQVEKAVSDLIEVTALFLPRTEKGNASLISTFSLSRRVKGDEQYEEIERNEVSVDWSLNYDSLQSGLVVFLDRLKSFAESSLVKYEALQNTINEARVRYENPDIRR